jgi:4-amino-4-deoxy-L-arabinose transferase-like glycosyltransferase
VLLAFSRTLFVYSSHVITDVPFTFFALLGLYCGARMLQEPSGLRWRWCLVAACLAAAACAVRPLGLALLMALAAALWLRASALRQWRANLAWTALLAAPTMAAAALWIHRGAAVGTAAGTSYFHWSWACGGSSVRACTCWRGRPWPSSPCPTRCWAATWAGPSA